MTAPAATVLESLQAQNSHLPRALAVHPAIADTSALLSDVMESVKQGQPSPLLIAMRVGIVRLMIAHNVWAEVPRNLAALGAGGRLDHSEAEALWWREYVPLIRVVSTASIPTSSSDEELGARDPTDLPTAQLHGLLSPIVLLATDRDLLDLGLTAEHWRLTATTASDLAEIGETAFAANLTLNLSVAGVAASTRLIFRLLGHPIAPAVLLAVGAGLTLTRDRWRPTFDEKADSFRKRAVAAWPAIEALHVEFQQRLADTYQRWDAAATGERGASGTHAVARLLARSAPMTRREIAEHLMPGATEAELRRTTARLAHLLHGCSAFAEARRGRWQVGMAGADFGGISAPPSIAIGSAHAL